MTATRRWTPPPISAYDSHLHIAPLIRTVVVVTLITSLFAAVVGSFFSGNLLRGLLSSGVIVGMELIAFITLRRGYVLTAAWLMAAMLWAGLLGIAVLSGGLTAATLSMLIVVVVIAALTTGSRGALLFSILSILAISALYFVETYLGGITPVLGETHLNIWLTGVAAVASASILVREAVRLLQQAGQAASDNEYELVRALSELQQTTVSNVYVESILHSMLDMLIVLDEDLKMETVNRSLVVALGYENEAALVGQPFASLLAEQDHTLLARLKRLVTESFDQLHTTATYVTQAGERRSVQLAANQLQGAPGGRRLVCVAQDITDRVQAERELARERNLLRTLLDSLPESVHVKDAAGRYVLSNRTHLSLLGAENQSEVIGKTLQDFFPDYLGALFQEDDQRIIDTGESLIGVERRGVDIAGNPVWIHTNRVPLHGETGEVEGVVVVAMDITERKRDEERLRESEARLRTVLQNAPVFIFAVDADLNLIFFEGQGAPPAGLQRMRDAVLSDDPADLRIAEGVAAALKGETVQTMATLEGLVFDLRFAPALTADGAITGVIGVATDITERTQAEAALRASEARNRALFDAMPDMMFVIGRDGIYNEVRTQNLNDLTHDPEEIIGAHVADHMDEALAADIMDALEMALQSGTAPPLEYAMTARGIRGYYEARFARLNEHEVVSLVRNITDRHYAAEEIRRREQMYRTLARNLPRTAVMLFDEELRFLIAEGDALTDVGFDPNNMEGRTLYDVLGEGPAKPVEGGYLAALRGETTRFELETRSRHYETTIIPIRNDQGAIFAGMVVTRDITEERRQQNELLQYASALERSNRELEEFAYIASHDLQEPLRKIQAFGGRLAARTEDTLDETALDYIERMQNAAERMQTLIEDLLTFSRLTTRAKPFREVDLNEVMRGVLADLELRIEATEATVIVADLPTIEAEPLQMRQLFQNLVGNALKYSRQDVPPQIYIRCESLADVTDEEQVRLVVQDNGIGFASHHSERIFGLFQRLHNRRQYEGTGMGLAICRKIAERHHGEVTATGVEGEGATFTVTLPVRQQDAHEPLEVRP
jgi:PAS domain S-box-containing protein